MAEFTPEQEDAISAGGSFIIVSAAAGSGKTTVLIEKLIRLLSDEEKGIRADKLIIVTFTNDAAAQIVRKLSIAMTKAIAGCGSDPDKASSKKWLIRQQSYLGAAKISTINSFCFNLIRSNADALGVAPDFRIIDAGEADLMLIRAIEETADEWFSDSERTEPMSQLFDFLGCFSAGSDKAAKYADIIGFRRFLLSIPYYKERYTEPLIKEYKKGFDDAFDPFDTIYGAAAVGPAADILGSKEITGLIKEIASEISKFTDDPAFISKLENIKSIATAKKHFENMTSVIEMLTEYINNGGKAASPDERWNAACEVLSWKPEGVFNPQLKPDPKINAVAKLYEASRSTVSPVKKRRTKDEIAADKLLAEQDKAYAAELVENLEQLARLFGRLPNITLCSAEELREDYRDHYRTLTILCDFLEDVNVHFDEMKRQKNGLIFEDGELLALKLLGVPMEDGNIIKTDTAQKLSEQFKFIMIDEFQDSNDIQDIIFRLLSPEGTMRTEGRNMFVVGDIKQSIYNFRLANPKLFFNYLSHSQPYSREEGSEEPRHILLNRNFRSSRKVIDFVNMIFRRLMSTDCGGIDYDNTQELIYSGEVWEKLNSQKAADIGDLSTEIILIDKDNAALNDEERDKEKADLPAAEETADLITAAIPDASDEEDMETVQLEAEAVALRIHKLLKTHPALSPRDICILVPKNYEAAVFEAALRELNIRSSLDSRDPYIETREISIALNLLKIVDDPHRSIAFAGVLMSPLFDLTADDMAVIAAVRGRQSFYTVTRKIAETGTAAGEWLGLDQTGTEALLRKLRGFFDIYDRIRKRAAVMSIEDTIRTIYSETELPAVMSLYPNGEKRRANLALLPEYARTYENGVTCGTGGVFGFIRYVDSMTENSMDFGSGSTASESDDAVAIKTIHKSKGLEYPIVFLCRAGEKMKQENPKIFKSLTMGTGFKRKNEQIPVYFKSLPAEVISQINQSDLISEHLRLMYVAMTRAKHKLFISGVMPLAEKDEKIIFTKEARFCNDIYRSCECDITDCFPVPKMEALFSGKEQELFSDNGKCPPPAAMRSTDGIMLHWIIAALAAEKKVRFFTPKGQISGEGQSDVIVKLMHVDSGLFKQLSGELDISEEDILPRAAEADEKLSAALEKYSAYDTDPDTEGDRAMESIPAKLTVTEITRRTAEDEEEELPPAENIIRYENRLAPISAGAEDNISRLNGAEKGTAVHAFMQYADLHGIREAADSGAADPVGDEAARLFLEDRLEKSFADYISGSSSMKKRILGFTRSQLWEKYISKAESGKILKEQPFMAKFSDIFSKTGSEPLDEKLKKYYNDNYNDTFIQGIADCIVLTDSGFLLIDYKTNIGKTPHELREMYSTQLLLYTRIFEMIFDMPPGSGVPYIYSLGIDNDCEVKI